MVACQRESIGNCAPLSSKALPRGVARATLHSSRIVGQPEVVQLLAPSWESNFRIGRDPGTIPARVRHRST